MNILATNVISVVFVRLPEYSSYSAVLSRRLTRSRYPSAGMLYAAPASLLSLASYTNVYCCLSYDTLRVTAGTPTGAYTYIASGSPRPHAVLFIYMADSTTSVTANIMLNPAILPTSFTIHIICRLRAVEPSFFDFLSPFIAKPHSYDIFSQCDLIT